MRVYISFLNHAGISGVTRSAGPQASTLTESITWLMIGTWGVNDDILSNLVSQTLEQRRNRVEYLVQIQT